MTHYEAIIGTQYSDDEYVEEAIADAMYHLSPLHMARAPVDINVYGNDDTEQMICIGVVFDTASSVEQIEDCGAESVERVPVEVNP